MGTLTPTGQKFNRVWNLKYPEQSRTVAGIGTWSSNHLTLQVFVMTHDKRDETVLPKEITMAAFNIVNSETPAP